MTELQLQEAIQHQVLYGGRLGTNLLELGYITEPRLQEALSRALGVPALAVDVREVQPEAVALVPKALAARYKVFPYKVSGKTLTLLMVEPRDHTAVAQVGFTLGYIVRPAVVPEFRMIQLLRDYHGVVVYGDAGPAGNVKADMGELLVLLQKVPKAYERIIRRRIAEARQITGPPEGPPEENE